MAKNAWILTGSTFVLLMAFTRTAFGSSSEDILSRWDSSTILAPIATALVVAILTATLFFVLTTRLAPRE